MSSAFILADDGPDNEYCSPPCDALLIQRKDGSKICSVCSREYLPTAVTQHKRDLAPTEDPHNDSEVPLISMTGYGSYAKKKPPSVFDREDRFIASKKSGFHWTEHEDLGPEGNPPI